MIKARKRFVLFAMFCVFLLLFVLLGIINGLNFTLASEDADRVTKMLAEQQGMFDSLEIPLLPDGNILGQQGMLPFPEAEQESMGTKRQDADSSSKEQKGKGQPATGQSFPNLQGNPSPSFSPGFIRPLGPAPASPDMEFSLRYFTYSFDTDGNAEQVAFQISAVTEEEALEWARSLSGEHETGWTQFVYRYRTYVNDGKTYVTVIDQGRELIPSYRILMISGIGLAVGLIVSCILLMYVGRRLFKPLEDADRKQKRFIADAEKEFKVPLTIINANTEIMERENGETDQTLSINRQVKKMLGLVKKLSNVGVFDEGELTKLQCDVSALAQAIGDTMINSFTEKERTLEVNADQPVVINADSEAISQLISELLENALKFSLSKAQMKVGVEDGHDVIIVTNDTNLPDGNYDQVFDRFTRLENAKDLSGAGLGLSHVKEIVQAHNGRASANVAHGVFILRINL
ncbi:MAG: HAMP domain-containing histidine kinase [Clostridia bacterium]|nr:HAMP domain-containing histidine kinase [Clostridia bacterium]MBR6966688.1 HAMP domain-containing histidine kinase [Clostridia bacterium]